MANSDLPWRQCFSPRLLVQHETPPRCKHSPGRVQAVDLHPTSIRPVAMKAVAALVSLLMNVRLSLSSCNGEGLVLICPNVPPAFSPGYSSLLMVLRDVGEINSTVFRSDSLFSVTRLRIEGAGVTGIAEGAFSSFMNLTYLSLNQNFLTEINPNWVGRPHILSELHLTENQIEVLHESTLNGFLNLTRLSLSKNRIRTIDPNSFSSQSVLAELDLSENRMTWVSPQAFSSLGSTRIRLDGNLWDCSCGAEDFVNFLKGLQNSSLLDRPEEVTCESPPSLRGQPVWNVSVCVGSPPPRPPSGPESTSAKVVTTPPSRPTSETKPSVRPKPTDAPITMSSNTAAHVTEVSVRPHPSDPPRLPSTPTGMTETCATSRPSSDTNIVFTLAVVIAVLCFFLFVAFFLALLHGRKRNIKTVTPGRPEEENRTELKDDSGSSGAQTPGRSEERENNCRDSEMGWRTSFTGVRAKSANAILFLSPFCAPVKDRVTLQTETEAQSKDAESQAEGRRKLGDETEVDGGGETADADVIKKAKSAEAGGDRDENSHHVPVNANTVPYLSIGSNQNKPGPDDVNEQSAEASGQRSRKGKVMGRISTWPPTAVQWQARCETKEGEVGSAAFTVWTPKCPGEGEKVLKTKERPPGSDWDRKEDDSEDILMEDFTAPNQDALEMTAAPVTLGNSQSSKPSDNTTERQLEEETIPDSVTVRQTQTLNEEIRYPNQDLKSAASPAQKPSGSKAERGGEWKRAATSRRRAENGSSGPKAPSGGASPDDETLLSGNEYAFMDLLHEVAQNNGRWTRDRRKQKDVNKQRRHDRKEALES